MSDKIFLSYAPQDRAIANRIRRLLKDYGVTATDEVEFIDPQAEIEPGENWRAAIKRQMGDASKVVIITSTDGAQSPWLNYEAGMASALGKPIVLVGGPGSGQTPLAQRLGAIQSVEIDDDL